MPGENEARERAAIEADRAEQEAFEVQFPAERFVGIADALRLPSDPETLSALRRVLLPEFRFFVVNCPGARLTREGQIGRLEKLRDAANALRCSLGPGGACLLFLRKPAVPN